MHIEAFHMPLKVAYLKQKKNRRVDMSINVGHSSGLKGKKRGSVLSALEKLKSGTSIVCKAIIKSSR